MEALGYSIEEKCSEKSWVPVKSSHSGVAFSHLFFADDLVLFAKVDHVNCSTVREVLDSFVPSWGNSLVKANLECTFLQMLM